MIYKGIVSAINDTGDRVAVTPHSGGIVTSWLVVPYHLAGMLRVGTSVIYTTFPDNTGIILHREDGAGVAGSDGDGGGVSFTTDETLTLDPETGVLSVNTADAVEQDNTLPVTSAAVHTTVGNVEKLLNTI